MDLALNYLQKLICHETQTTNQPNQKQKVTRFFQPQLFFLSKIPKVLCNNQRLDLPKIVQLKSELQDSK